MSDETKSRVQKKAANTKQAKRKTNKKTNKLWTVIKVFVLAILMATIVALIAGFALFKHYTSDAPKITDDLLADTLSSKIYDSDGKVFAELGTEKREHISLKDTPKELTDALISVEDVRFYDHHGVDPIRIVGAAVANLTGGFGSQGGSTLTQQVIKLSLNNTDATIKRKAQEAYLAMEIEKKYSKADILEIYINKVYMGDSIYGMATGADHFYGKPLSELTVPQMALLVGIPNSPNELNPFDHPEDAKTRRDTVLERMYHNEKITAAQLAEYKAVPINKGLVSEKRRIASMNSQTDSKYNNYVTQVIKEVQANGKYDVYTDGLKIYTSLDTSAQKYADKLATTNDIITYSDDRLTTGFVFMDSSNGQILAIGSGNRNSKQDVKLGFNFATDINRQPGSTFKPLADYAPAIEYLNWSTAHIIDDSKYEYSSGDEINNWDRQYQGEISIRQALYDSRNIPALKTLQAVGLERSLTFMEKMGFSFDRDKLGESISIGAYDKVNPLLLTGGYGALANNGVYNTPHTVNKIETRQGDTINMEPESERVMEAHTAYMVTDMLKDTLTKGTGTSAAIYGLPAAGKTGTTNYTDQEMTDYGISSSESVPDSWFAGYTTRYTMGVWTGYEEKKVYLSKYEQNYAKLIYREMMSYMSSKVSTNDFVQPNDVVSRSIAAKSNPPLLAAKGTTAVTELFIDGTQPTSYGVSPVDAEKRKAAAKKKAEAAKQKEKEAARSSTAKETQEQTASSTSSSTSSSSTSTSSSSTSATTPPSSSSQSESKEAVKVPKPPTDQDKKNDN
ncbi:transglycosylase domain-containing protein [Brochothrix campestris]|uniref:transglycosylase domain-containing protein n=1 Tax=Brochothrix campestris TaxID=2757 RepID=UPI0038D21F90